MPTARNYDGRPARTCAAVSDARGALTAYGSFVYTSGSMIGLCDLLGALPTGREAVAGSSRAFRNGCMFSASNGLTAYRGVPEFPDTPLDFWALDAIERCFHSLIVTGYPDGTYRPSEVVTRDQMAVYVTRAFGLPQA
jgi:hypothetical protein